MNKENIEYWFTANGNHIPVKKGQTKEQALDEFLKEKGDVRGYSIEELKEKQKRELNEEINNVGNGSYKRYKAMSKSEREKSKKSHQKRLDLHIDKIKNPEKYIPDWSTFSRQRKSGMLAFWGKEVVNFQKQIKILEEIEDE